MIWPQNQAAIPVLHISMAHDCRRPAIKAKNHIDLFGASILVFHALLFGLNQVLVKMVNAGLQPVFQAGLRSAFAILPVVVFAVLMRKRLSVSDGSLPFGIFCGLFFALEFLLMFMALDFTTVARVSVLFYTMPVWLTLAAHFLLPNEGLTRSKVAGLMLAVGGIAVAMVDRGTDGADGSLRGDLMALAGAMCWAAIALLARATPLKKSSPEMQILYQLVVSAAVLLPVALLFGGLIREMTPFLWGIFAFQVVVVVAFGFSLWFWILSIYPASSTASFSFLAPVFGVLFGWLILGEAITWTLAVALVMVCTGIVLINRAPLQRA